MVFYRSKYYHYHLVRLLALSLLMVLLYQSFLIQRFRTELLERERQYNQSKIGRKLFFPDKSVKVSLRFLCKKKNRSSQFPAAGISAFAHYSPEGREYNSASHPFIFIGGHPRSGTTLLRAMLDSHPQVRQEI